MNKAFLLVLMLLAGRLFAVAGSAIPSDTIFQDDTAAFQQQLLHSPGSAELMVRKAFPKMNEENRKKLISAILAFPFPFGFMGAHRVMLGCKPWIPVVYVATFGGCFGLLPMIDFIAILCSKDIAQYENNPHVFMWLK